VAWFRIGKDDGITVNSDIDGWDANDVDVENVVPWFHFVVLFAVLFDVVPAFRKGDL